MSPRRTSERGFTLLECEIALLILTLSILMLSRLDVSHELLVSDMEAWVQGDPVRYVVLRESHLERLLQHSATLAETAPDPLPAPPATDYEVTVLAVTRQLYPLGMTALVDVVEN